MTDDPRRLVPRTDDVLASPLLTAAMSALPRAVVKAAVAQAQDRVRRGKLDPASVATAAAAALHSSSLRRVINATGVVLHTNLGRAPLSAAARAALLDAAAYTDVEFDLSTGQRATRGRGAIAALLSAVPAAGDALIVNNGAAALLLAATALAAGREIVISRGELVEIGDGFRLPELLVSTGARLREVGTTNRTSLRDYTDAIGPETGAVVKVHPSNFQIVGYTSAVSVRELATLAVPVIVDIGSGLLAPDPLLPDEPDATSSLHAGAALVTASGDKLLGGPQAGLVLGDVGLVQRLRQHPLARALRADKLTLAAIEATVRAANTPTYDSLHADPAVLHSRAEQLVLALVAAGIDARTVGSAGAVGGGGAPGVELAGSAVSLPSSYAAPLRDEAIVGRTLHDRCLLDLRCVPIESDEAVLAAVLAVATCMS
ncbi:MAG: L-seryl-tRNA(Sec) selenium transferase [Mycobacteriales bacterium]